MEFEGRIPSKKNSRVNLPDGRSFPSRAYLKWQEEARMLAKIAWRRKPMEGQIAVTIVTGLKNDLDNLASSCLDALQGVVYQDDRQVSYLVVIRDPAMGKRTKVRVAQASSPTNHPQTSPPAAYTPTSTL